MFANMLLAQASEAISEEAAAFSTLDMILFLVAVVGVIFLGIWKSKDRTPSDGGAKKEKSAADYFLAGRGLTWWLVGFSLIAANISTEQFVGMSGQAADWLGMAIASYEWLAAITLVVVAFLFLPKLLRHGVYTIPEFLEYRYNTTARSVMAVANLLVLVGVPTATVIYSGAKVIIVFFAGYSLFGMPLDNLALGCGIIAFAGAIYVYVGGLKACAWTDLIWGAALIVGGGVVAYLAIQYLGKADPQMLWDSRAATSDATVDQIANAGALDRLQMLNTGEAVTGANGVGGKFHMIRPNDDSTIPWSALLLGLWIPNFYYWGLNQYIMQRTLASKSLGEGQMGIVFAAFLKLLIPFIVVIPGILAYNLFSSDLREDAVVKNYDSGVEIIMDANAYRQKELAKKGAKPEAIDEKIAEAGRTIYPITDGFVAVETEKARAIIAHNMKLVYKATPLGVEKLAAVEAELDTVAKDAANTETNRGQRLILASAVTKFNEETIKYAKEQKMVEGMFAAAPLKEGTKMVGYDYDGAFPTLLKKLLKPGISWFVLASLFGAVVSSLASMLNSASTIFTMDIYHKFRKNADAGELVWVGKLGVLVCVLIAFLISLKLGDPKFGGIFNFIQEFQGFISPGALCVFLFGFFIHKCPRFFGWFGIALNVVLYSMFMIFFSDVPFLNRMAICFLTIAGLGFIFTLINAMRGAQPVVLPVSNKVDIAPSSKARNFGIVVVIATIALYIIFW